jgi:zinc protease
LDAGYAADQFSEPGTSSLAMAMLDEGTIKLSALEISDAAANIGAIISANAGIDSSSVSLSALKESIDASLKLYADIILNPSFPKNELERLRKQRLAQIQQEKNQPFGIALRILPKLLYGEDHAYSLPLTGSGTEISVQKITQESLIKFHQDWFKPNNGSMVVVGDTTMEEIKPKLEKYFKNWSSGSLQKKNILPVEIQKEEIIYLIDRPGAHQSIVLAANIAPSPANSDELAVESMNEVIGGSFTSRINMNLREDKGWAYGARTLILQTKEQRPFIAYAPVQTDKTAESITEIKRELLEYLANNPVTEEELNKVKDNNTLSLPGRWETIRAISNDLSEIITYGLADDYWDKYSNNVRNLTRKRLIDAAASTIKPENLIWVIVGDRSKIEDEISALSSKDIKILDRNGEEITLP